MVLGWSAFDTCDQEAVSVTEQVSLHSLICRIEPFLNCFVL